MLRDLMSVPLKLHKSVWFGRNTHQLRVRVSLTNYWVHTASIEFRPLFRQRQSRGRWNRRLRRSRHRRGHARRGGRRFRGRAKLRD